jgi:putative transposase
MEVARLKPRPSGRGYSRQLLHYPRSLASPDIQCPFGTFDTHFLITSYEHSPMLATTRTYRAQIVNHHQVQDDLDQCGFSASKLWNVARYYTQGRWDDDGEIPDDGELKSELKEHERYSDLHSQSSSFENLRFS